MRADRSAARRAEKRYHERNREKRNAYSKAYMQTWVANNRDEYNRRANANTKRWLDNNPEKKLLHFAKNYLATAMSVRVADLPVDLVAAKVEILRVKWAIRDSDGSPKGGDGEASAVHDSAVPQGDAQ